MKVSVLCLVFCSAIWPYQPWSSSGSRAIQQFLRHISSFHSGNMPRISPALQVHKLFNVSSIFLCIFSRSIVYLMVSAFPPFFCDFHTSKYAEENFYFKNYLIKQFYTIRSWITMGEDVNSPNLRSSRDSSGRYFLKRKMHFFIYLAYLLIVIFLFPSVLVLFFSSPVRGSGWVMGCGSVSFPYCDIYCPSCSLIPGDQQWW